MSWVEQSELILSLILALAEVAYCSFNILKFVLFITIYF